MFERLHKLPYRFKTNDVGFKARWISLEVLKQNNLHADALTAASSRRLSAIDKLWYDSVRLQIQCDCIFVVFLDCPTLFLRLCSCVVSPAS